MTRVHIEHGRLLFGEIIIILNMAVISRENYIEHDCYLGKFQILRRFYVSRLSKWY